MTTKLITPLHALNETLGDTLEPGHFILAYGLQGGGKTILACQLVAACARQGIRALFISTEAQVAEIYRRILSAQAGISYAKIADGPGLVGTRSGGVVLNGAVFGAAVQEQSTALVTELNKYCGIVRPAGFGAHPEQKLQSVVESFAKAVGAPPEVIIVDYIKDSADMPDNSYAVRKAVMDIGAALQACAKNRNMCIWAFLQARPDAVTSKILEVDQISMFPKLAGLADATVGISHRERTLTSDAELDEPSRIYNRVQHLTVRVNNANSVVIPVVCEFEYQRFAPYVPGAKVKNKTKKSEDELKRLAEEITRTNEFPGYVLVRRKMVETILQYRNQNALNLYTFFLLVSNKRGKSFWSRENIGRKLGLSAKQVRTGAESLEASGLIQISPMSLHQSLDYQVTDWGNDQLPSVRGYFKLFRNLRDQSRQDLLSNPRMLRVWLYLLCHAKNYTDEGTDFQPGESLVALARTTDELRITKGELISALEGLKERGSIAFDSTQDRPLISIVNWELYNKFIHPGKDSTNYQYNAGHGEV